MNAPTSFPRGESVIASLRSSASVAESLGYPVRAENYARMADDAEQSGLAFLYRHWAREAEVWAAEAGDAA